MWQNAKRNLAIIAKAPAIRILSANSFHKIGTIRLAMIQNWMIPLHLVKLHQFLCLPNPLHLSCRKLSNKLSKPPGTTKNSSSVQYLDLDVSIVHQVILKTSNPIMGLHKSMQLMVKNFLSMESVAFLIPCLKRVFLTPHLSTDRLSASQLADNNCIV